MPTVAEGEGILRDIIAHPERDDLRLVMADWCEENGDMERAEFIRVQLRLAKLEAIRGAAMPENTHAGRMLLGLLRRRESELRSGFYEIGGFCTYRRGFPHAVRCPLAAWIQHGKALAAAHPLERVELSDRKPSQWYRPPYGDWYWVRQHGDTGHLPDRLPPELYATLPPGAGEDDDVMTYIHERDARDALSLACIAYGRS